MSSMPSDIERFVREVLELAVAAQARDLRRRAATMPSLPISGEAWVSPSELAPPPRARPSAPDSGRYSLVGDDVPDRIERAR
jgi:hypothetical protein